MGITGLRAATTQKRVGEDDVKDIAGTRDGALWTVPWKQALLFEGRAFSLQLGDENAPIDNTVVIDDELVMASIDIPAGTTALLYWAQCVVATWSDTATFDFMIEIDRAQARRTSGGTAYTPLNLRTDSPIASLSTVFVGPDVALVAKTTNGSLEVFRESVEINTGNVTHYWPPFEYKPKILEAAVGPASIILHFGAANGGTDATIYGSMHWFEIPSTSVV